MYSTSKEGSVCVCVCLCVCARPISIIFVRFYWILEFYRQIFEKSSTIKCHGNPSSASRIVPRGRDGHTNRHDETDGHFSILRTRVKTPYVLLSLRFIIFSHCAEHSQFDSDKCTSTSWGSNPSVKIGFTPQIMRNASYQAGVVTSRHWACVRSEIVRKCRRVQESTNLTMINNSLNQSLSL